MKATRLERLVIGTMTGDVAPESVRLDMDAVVVLDRTLTGSGFLTELERSRELRILPEKKSLRWGKIGARLNEAKIETSYVVYVNDGYIDAVEGYTYGDDWPPFVGEIELYWLVEGMALMTKPRG